METLTPDQLEKLRSFGSCVVASAVETFHVRLPNVGFTNAGIQCAFRERAPMAGYAVTAKIRSARPPMEGGRYYYDHADWWDYILTVPSPRVVVLEDEDDPPGLGALVGQVNAEILKALGCTAVVTNGAVRDIATIEPIGLQVFAGNLSVSHAYAHVFEFGGSVRVAGLTVAPGDLLHGDVHGIVNVPKEIAGDIPALASQIEKRREAIVNVCRSPKFTIDALQKAIRETELTGYSSRAKERQS